MTDAKLLQELRECATREIDSRTWVGWHSDHPAMRAIAELNRHAALDRPTDAEQEAGYLPRLQCGRDGDIYSVYGTHIAHAFGIDSKIQHEIAQAIVDRCNAYPALLRQPAPVQVSEAVKSILLRAKAGNETVDSPEVHVAWLIGRINEALAAAGVQGKGQE